MVNVLIPNSCSYTTTKQKPINQQILLGYNLSEYVLNLVDSKLQHYSNVGALYNWQQMTVEITNRNCIYGMTTSVDKSYSI